MAMNVSQTLLHNAKDNQFQFGWKSAEIRRNSSSTWILLRLETLDFIAGQTQGQLRRAVEDAADRKECGSLWTNLLRVSGPRPPSDDSWILTFGCCLQREKIHSQRYQRLSRVSCIRGPYGVVLRPEPATNGR